MTRVYAVAYWDGEATKTVAVLATEALVRAFWDALPDGRWGSYTVCKEHCEIQEHEVMDAPPDMARYAGVRPEDLPA